jgi:hypothetical protein
MASGFSAAAAPFARPRSVRGLSAAALPPVGGIATAVAAACGGGGSGDWLPAGGKLPPDAPSSDCFEAPGRRPGLAPAAFNAPAKADWAPPALAGVPAAEAADGPIVDWTDVWMTGAVFMEGEFASGMPRSLSSGRCEGCYYADGPLKCGKEQDRSKVAYCRFSVGERPSEQ